MEPGVPARQAVSIVEAQEIDPPAGVKPAHWRLLTSHQVETFEQARWITQLDRRRWVIEPVFRTLKTQGFDIKNVSVETAPFKTLCAMTFVAGISCRPLVPDRDGAGQRPLKDVFEAPDPPALEVVSASLEGPTDKPKNPHPRGSLAFAAWVCARLVAGPDIMGNRAPWSCYAGCINSGPSNSDMASLDLQIKLSSLPLISLLKPKLITTLTYEE